MAKDNYSTAPAIVLPDNASVGTVVIVQGAHGETLICRAWSPQERAGDAGMRQKVRDALKAMENEDRAILSRANQEAKRALELRRYSHTSV